MLSGVTLVRVSVSRARERGAMMAMAAERAGRARRVGRMTCMPRVMSKAPQGHDHEARCPECNELLVVSAGVLHLGHYHFKGEAIEGLIWTCSDMCFLSWEPSQLMSQA